jgi:murein DD-endopeptidase MepM/ murein hydrolase activator NlpD
MREKYLTLLVVPHDEHNVRQIKLSYRRLQVLAALLGVVLVTVLVGVASYGRVAARAGRAVALERENARLEAENAKVDAIALNLARTEQAYEQIRSMAGLKPEVLPVEDVQQPAGAEPRSPRGWPLATKGFVTAPFDGVDGHSGVDIAVPSNTPVVATASGKVTASGSDEVLGEYVVIDHDDGYETMYAHNANRLVSSGAAVERGQTIAYSGSTGRSTAPHLHYEVRRRGEPVDPAPYMR